MKRTTLLWCVVGLGFAIQARADLISYYDFEGPNPFADKVSGVVGAVGANVTIESGTPHGNAAVFPNGSRVDNDILVAQGDAPVIGLSDFTCMAWVRRADITTDADGICDMVTGTTTGGFQMLLVADFRLGVGGPGNQWMLTQSLNPVPQDMEWHHYAASVDRDNPAGLSMYIDGVLDSENDPTGYASVFMEANQDYQIGSMNNNSLNGSLDELAIFNTALTAQEIRKYMKGIGSPPELAANPSPEDEAVDVPYDVVLSWSPGEFAAQHDVYLGTIFADVNDAHRANPLGVLVSQGQDGNVYDPGHLVFGQTYYWRVDEVNGAPDNIAFKGQIWSFTAEPLAVPVTNIAVTASSAHDEDMSPDKTIDGSGLDDQDLHSSEPKAMWLSGMGDPTPSIQYEFDKAYKLHEMWVWNSNQLIEGFVGLGAKDVTMEVSSDGTDWTVLEGVPQFAQAPGKDGYVHNITIALGGVMAQYVRLTINDGYGLLPQAGLSEVRFLFIPTFARSPQPADGDTSDTVDVVLTWRAGREAASHEIYLGTDATALDLVATVTDNSYTATDLDYATTYFWQIMEVNNAETPAAHASPVWRFNTPAYGTVEDFDQYDDACNRIFFAWLDGLGHNGSEGIENCNVAPYNGNGTGSIVGNATSPFAEQARVYAGSQSMPLAYDVGVSETTITLAPKDWTAGGIRTLSLYVYGAPGNTGQLYLKINNTKVVYQGLPDALQRQQWIPWNIDLDATGAILTNVTSLTLGIEGASSQGMIYVDEIRLYPLASQTIDPVVPDDGDPSLVAHYAFEGNTDDSQGHYPGTPAGGPTYTSGKIGQGISLDEVDDQVVYVFAQEEVWSAYTVSLWARTDFMAQNANSSLFSSSITSAAGFQIDLDGTDPGNYRYRGSATSVFGPASSSWVHIGVSCDGTQTRIYYNGILAGTLTAADTTFTKLAVGVNRAEDNWFGGVIDEVRVYDRALSSGEMAGLAGISTPIDVAFVD